MIPSDAPEQLCPECLLAPTAEQYPRRIGPFQIMKLLGEGGFGCVFLAQRGAQKVALKVLRDGQFADRSARARFTAESALLAKLNHPGIVAIGEAGEHEGAPYFTMEYMPGGTLRQKMDRFRFAPEHAAALVIQVARIVEFLHRDPQRPARAPVLHRDLKPENILFDGEGRPRVADFGIAKLANGRQTWSRGSSQVGCVYYMAPEQAANGKLTQAADVYALGAILYELFTGHPPFEGDVVDVLRQLESEEPIAPRRLVKDLDRFLETVVLNALEKDPARRYRTAHAFAEDLQRALKQEPPEYVPTVAASARAWQWMRRRPLATATMVWVGALGVVVGAGLHSALVDQETSLNEQQDATSAMASVQAVAMKFQLREYAHRVAVMAQDPAIRALLYSATVQSPSPTLVERAHGFDTIFLMGPDGRQRARTSARPDSYLQRSFAFRDYFRGARRLALTACAPGQPGPASAELTTYVARAYTSESDGHFEFAISAPVCDARGWLGVVAGTIATNAALGSLRLVDDRKRHITALLGPRDNERKNAYQPLPTGFTFVAHPGLQHGQLQELLEPKPGFLRAALGIPAGSNGLRYAAPLRVDDYRDPVLPAEHWAAAFAPVDESEDVVVVQARRGDQSAASQLFEHLAVPAGIPFGVALALLIGFKLAALENERRRSRARPMRIRPSRVML